ncbi:hypothetical protein ACWFMI_05240 [Nocardiopsis terrae]
MTAGLTRSSLYDAFHSKEHLFRRALSCYVTTMTTRQATLLDTAGATALERVRALLAAIAEEETANRAGWHGAGCFTVDTITAVASRNQDIARLVEVDLQRRLSGLRPALNTDFLAAFAPFAHVPAAALLSMTGGIGLVGITLNPALITRVQRAGNTRALVNTVHSSFITLGVVLGSWFGGMGVDALGLRGPLWAGAALALLAPATMVPPALRAARVGQEAADTEQERSSGGEGPENILVP